MDRAFFISIPHSGEQVPEEVFWLKNLSEPHLMRDVDRFVDVLYGPAIRALDIPSVVAKWHRYVVDLNRLPEDIDCDSVEGANNPPGTFPTGLHWRVTTIGETLISEPISMELHSKLVDKYFWPFHKEVEAQFDHFRKLGCEKVYHLDAHSMPSMGTAAHRDPGQRRSEIVVSDVDGTSCESRFLDLVVGAYEEAGFEVKVNFPYKGGRVTQTYGKPDQGQHSIQVEMNRALYMNEETKEIDRFELPKIQGRIQSAIKEITDGLPIIVK